MIIDLYYVIRKDIFEMRCKGTKKMGYTKIYPRLVCVESLIINNLVR